MTVTRRVFLKRGLGVIGGAGLIGCLETGGAGAEDLASRFRDLRGAEEIGRAYLETRPQEADPAVLTRLLEPERGWPALEARIRSDYRESRVIRLKGWPLSITEARLYAWTALRARG